MSPLDFAQDRLFGDDNQERQRQQQMQRLVENCQVLLLVGFGLLCVFRSFFGFGCGAFGLGCCFFGVLLGLFDRVWR